MVKAQIGAVIPDNKIPAGQPITRRLTGGRPSGHVPKGVLAQAQCQHSGCQIQTIKSKLFRRGERERIVAASPASAITPTGRMPKSMVLVQIGAGSNQKMPAGQR
jgi:hypothetical protein